MQIQSRLYFIATILATLAFAAVGTAQTASANSNQTSSGFKPAFAGKYFQAPKTGSNPTSNNITISADSSTSTNGQTFTLQLPPDAVTSSLKVTLNGNDVSGHFRGTTATLYAQDGLSTVKNVLSATVKVSSGGMASGRWRSMSAPVNKNSMPPNATPRAMARAAGATVSPRANAIPTAAPVCDPVNMCPAWLPPSVRFDTLQKGGWTLGSSPWFQVNGIPYGYTGDNASGAQYVVVALDRQTLQITDFSWFSSSSSFSNYITKYTSSDLVIGGTTAGSSPVNTSLDTSSIGGTNFGTCKCTLPQSYMIVGSGGQAPGTAYESKQSANAFATGSLLEDANGNYNFQSSDIVEYAIEPQDPGYYGNPTIEMKVPQNLSVAGESGIEFTANALAGQNGLWLLVLDRTTLMPPFNSAGTSAPCSDIEPSGAPTRVVVNCGTFYAVGAGNSNIDGEWHALASALSAVTSSQIVFLQSIGTVGVNNLAQTVTSGSAFPNQTFTGFAQFAGAVAAVGGTGYAIAGPTYTNQDNYALVGFLGAGNALTGGAAELSTAFPGQLGVLHGTLQRDAGGLYRPAQTSPEQQAMFNEKGGLTSSDFTLSVTSYQQPGEWPSNSATVLLPAASSVAGQQAAFRFISHWLLAGYYMKTIQGPHQDDIHFFFSGSTNTSINYQTMDPANLPALTVGTWTTFGCTSFDGTTCTFQATGDSGPSTFTVSDFNAVKAQLSLEVIYLTNTLQYMVTGSTNLKNIVASGNANVGLALSAAANTIEGSGMANLNAQAIANKQVSFSWQSLVSTIGGIAEVAANLEAGGELTPAFDALDDATKASLKTVNVTANLVGSVMSTIGSGGAIKTSSSALSSSPQPFVALTTTVGELATQDLQSPLIIGFDTTADNITSDWGRLSTIGPRTTNTADLAFFAPNQVSQVAAINAMTTASASSFYSSLLPTVYNMHVWNGVTLNGPTGGFQPSVGSLQEHLEQDTCNAFYLTPNSNNAAQQLGTLSVYQGIAYPSVGGGPQPFTQDEGYVDFWVIDGAVSKAGSNDTNITVMDADLATNLFAPTQLNIPMLQLFSGNGPMTSAEKDASVDKISGWSDGDVCDASDPYYNPAANAVSVTPPPTTPTTPTTPTKTATATTFISPTSGVLGHDAVFTTQVMAGNQPVPSGVVYISVDGTVVGNPSVGTNGTASFTVPGGIALGNHQIQADFAPGAGSTYGASSAQPATFVVYSESADISISMASTSMNVSYSTASTPVTLQIGSIAGLAGNVVLSCTGLPVGLACNFNAPSMTLAANGSVSATVQIGPSPTAQVVPALSSLAKVSIAILILPLVGIGGLRRSRPLIQRIMLIIVAAGVTAVALTGCSGGSPANPTPTRETGTRTITINASVGSVSRSAGMNITIQ